MTILKQLGKRYLWKYFFFALGAMILISCSQVENSITLENCDYTICESGRNDIDTLIDAHGVLVEHDGMHYIEVTGNGFKPQNHYISCMKEQITLPNGGAYVKFSAYVKDACSEEVSAMTDSVTLFEIEKVDPLFQESCENQILNDGFDIDQNDEKLKIHHLTIVEDCLSVLVSFVGSCDQIPSLSLHSGGDLLFGGAQVVVSLQGPIIENCTQEQYAVLRFDLTPLRDSLSGSAIKEITLYFLSQGLLRVHYPFAE